MRTVDLILWEDSEDERRAGEYLRAEEELAHVEAELTEAKELLRTFTVEHDRLVKPLYAELNGLEAEIADIHARRAAGAAGAAGEDDDAPDAEQRARERARERARASDWDAFSYSAGQRQAAAQPSAETKKIYRRLARLSHPDLAADDGERAVREVFMARVNNAYARGDVDALSTLTAEWDGARPPSSGSGARQARVPRPRPVPVDVLGRLARARAEILALKATGLGVILFDSAEGDMADAVGRLEAIASDVRERIAERRAALSKLLQDTA